MNNQNENNNINTVPYKATTNMNTMIGNPNANINNTMNINIQSMATNNVTNVSTNNNVQSQYELNTPLTNKVELGNFENENKTVLPNASAFTSQVNSTPNVNRTYVATDNKPKKKKLTINLGSEFKVALLIIVILLVFIFILPLISNLIGM